MKKLLILVGIIALSTSVNFAGDSQSEVAISGNSSAYATASLPSNYQGLYKNGSDFIIVRDTWVRIVINQQMNEYDFNAEACSNGYSLNLGGGQNITVYSDGTLYYAGTKFIKG